jgi:hypothetical protein
MKEKDHPVSIIMKIRCIISGETRRPGVSENDKGKRSKMLKYEVKRGLAFMIEPNSKSTNAPFIKYIANAAVRIFPFSLRCR